MEQVDYWSSWSRSGYVEQPAPITNAFTSTDNCRKGNMFLDSKLFDGAGNRKENTRRPHSRKVQKRKRNNWPDK